MSHTHRAIFVPEEFLVQHPWAEDLGAMNIKKDEFWVQLFWYYAVVVVAALQLSVFREHRRLQQVLAPPPEGEPGWYQLSVLVACYTSLFLAPLLSTRVTVLYVLYLIAVVIALFVHQYAKLPFVTLLRFWFVVVIYSAFTLGVRYSYQFEHVYTWINQVWPDQDILTLEDIGLRKLEPGWPVTKWLLPPTLVFGASVIQFHMLLAVRRYRRHAGELHEEVRMLGIFRPAVLFFLRFCYAYAPLLTIGITWFVIASNPSLMQALYLLVIVGALCLQRLEWVWSPLTVLAVFLLFSRYLFQFPYVYKMLGSYDEMCWLGYASFKGKRAIEALYGEVLVLVICTLHRVAHRYLHPAFLERMFAPLPIEHYTPPSFRPQSVKDPTDEEQSLAKKPFKTVVSHRYLGDGKGDEEALSPGKRSPRVAPGDTGTATSPEEDPQADEPLLHIRVWHDDTEEGEKAKDAEIAGKATEAANPDNVHRKGKLETGDKKKDTEADTSGNTQRKREKAKKTLEEEAEDDALDGNETLRAWARLGLFIRLFVTNVFSRLLHFVLSLPRTYGVECCVFLLLFTAVWRCNMLSVLLVILVSPYVFVGREALATRCRWQLLLLLLVCSLLFQYFFVIVWSACQAPQPHKWGLSEPYQRWLMVGFFQAKDIHLDFLVLLAVALQLPYMAPILPLAWWLESTDGTKASDDEASEADTTRPQGVVDTESSGRLDATQHPETQLLLETSGKPASTKTDRETTAREDGLREAAGTEDKAKALFVGEKELLDSIATRPSGRSLFFVPSELSSVIRKRSQTQLVTDVVDPAYQPSGVEALKIAVAITARDTWLNLRFWALLVSDKVFVLVIFIAGTYAEDLFSLGFLLFSIYLLFERNTTQEGYKAWRALQKYNLLIFLMYMIFQVPDLTLGSVAYPWDIDWAKVIGLNKFYEWPLGVDQPPVFIGFTTAGALHSIVVFILADIQIHIFQSAEYQNIYKYKREYDQLANQRATEAVKTLVRKSRRKGDALILKAKHVDSNFALILQKISGISSLSDAFPDRNVWPTPPLSQQELKEAAAGKLSLVSDNQAPDEEEEQAQPKDTAAPKKQQQPMRLGHKIARQATVAPWAKTLGWVPAGLPIPNRVRHGGKLVKQNILHNLKFFHRFKFWKGERLVAHYCNRALASVLTSDETEDCILLTTKRFAKIERGTLLQLIELDQMKDISLTKRNSFHWDSIEITLNDDSVESIGVWGRTVCIFFYTVLREEHLHLQAQERGDEGFVSKLGLVLQESKMNFRSWCARHTDQALWMDFGDPPTNPQTLSTLLLIYRLMSSHTKWMLFLLYCTAMFRSPSLVTVIIPACFLLFGIIEYPAPQKGFWSMCLAYTSCVIMLQFIFQLDTFCITLSDRLYSVQPDPFCPPPMVNEAYLHPSDWQMPVLLGVYKKESGAFALFVVWHLMCVIGIAWHRSLCIGKGLWLYTVKDRSEAMLLQALDSAEAAQIAAETASEVAQAAVREEEEHEARRASLAAASGEAEDTQTRRASVSSVTSMSGSRMSIDMTVRRMSLGKLSLDTLAEIEADSGITAAPDVEADATGKPQSMLVKIPLGILEVLGLRASLTRYRQDVLEANQLAKVLARDEQFPDRVSPSAHRLPTPQSASHPSTLIVPASQGKAAASQEEEKSEDDDDDAATGPIKDGDRVTPASGGVQESGASNPDIARIALQPGDPGWSEQARLTAEAEVVRCVSELDVSLGKLAEARRIFRAVRTKAGADLYTTQFVLELIAVFYLLLGYNAMATTSNDTVAAALNSNIFSGELVAILFGQIAFILIDRTIYLFRALGPKLIFHYFNVIFWIYMIVFQWPQRSQTGVRVNPTLGFFLVLKLTYLGVSARQIHKGYHAAAFSPIQNLTAKPSAIRGAIFQVYRALPFVFELRTLMDWMWTKTALNISEIFKLEDTYANVFINQCNLISYRKRKRGEIQGTMAKLLNGFLMFIGLLAVICLPILLFSSANPATVPNNVLRAKMTVLLSGPSPESSGINEFTLATISNTNVIRTVTEAEYVALKQNNVIYDDPIQHNQVVAMATYSDVFWNPPPPVRAALKAMMDMAPQDAVFARVKYEFERPGPDSQPISSGLHTTPLSREQRDTILRVLNVSNPEMAFTLTNLVPNYLRLPPNGDPISIGPSTYTDVVFTKTASEESFFWSVTAAPTRAPQGLMDSPAYAYGEEQDGVQITLTSNPTWSGLLASSGISYSITAVYIGVVLTVGRFVRMIFSGLQQRIMFEDGQDMEFLIMFCEGIYIARHRKDFLREEELYRRLIWIYRNPSLLASLTTRPPDIDRPPDPPATSPTVQEAKKTR